jgi:glycosyltransferase involved in cell wall biosynthesis
VHGSNHARYGHGPIEGNDAVKPTIALDARMIGMGGIGRYTESLLTEMLRLKPRFNWILVGDTTRLNQSLKKSGIPDAVLGTIQIRHSTARVYSLEEAFGLQKLFVGADLTHFPHFNAPMNCRTKVVVTLHDLIHFDFPEYQPFFGANRLLDWKIRRLLKRADGVLTVSEHTAACLKKRYESIQDLNQKLKVIWEGAESVFDPGPKHDDADRLRKLKIHTETPIVLYVGAIREHKQTQVLAEAFETLRRKNPGLKAQLVLCGRLDARFDRKWQFGQKIQASAEIVHCTDANDEDLAALYRSASVVVMPSKAEGFGLPVVEAMRSCAPVIISDIPVLQEIAGSAALMFKAGDSEQLAEGLHRVLSDGALRADLKEKSIARGRTSGLFEWKNTATQTLDFYEEVLRGG